MATHSSVLAWRMPGTGEPDGLSSMGSHRVRHDWSDLAAAAAPINICVEAFVWAFVFISQLSIRPFLTPPKHSRVEIEGGSPAPHMTSTNALGRIGGFIITAAAGAAAAKSLQSCPTLCDPIDGRPPGSPVPGILQARALEWVAISFSNAWKWKVKMKSFSCVWLLATPRTAAHQAPPSIGFSRQEDWGGLPLPPP